MEYYIEAKARELHEHLAKLNPDERIEVMNIVMNEYCTDCGADRGPYGCPCTRDD
jgi:hypothetical protein